jgi:hypothetical protein
MRWISGLVVVVMMCSALARAEAPKVSPDEAAANAAMAERFAQMAQMMLAGQTIVPATLRQSAILLEEASRLNPDEPRFPRLAAEAYIQLSSQLEKAGLPIDEARDGAIAALDRYFKIPSVAGDQHAQVQFIDLQYSKMDAGDARRNYLQQLIGAQSLAAEVRAHACILMAQLAVERGEIEASRQYVQDALKLFPLSPTALRMQYQQLEANTPPERRTAALVHLLRSNPAQPGAMADLAAILADAGLVDPALQWYQQSFGLSQRLGIPPNANVLTSFAAQLVIADQLTVAQTFLQQLLAQDTTNADASFLALLVAKRSADPDKVNAATEATRNALKARLGKISDVLNDRQPAAAPPAPAQPGDAPAGAPPAPEQPAAAPLDIPGDLKLLGERNNATANALYGSSLADLAWLEIYYNGKPADAEPYLAALRQLLPADAIILARLEGWGFLVDGKKDEAKVKLSAVADLDPFARLGMIRMEETEAGPEKTNQAVKALLADNAAGVVGAMLIEALRDKVGLMPAAPHASAVRAELEKLPKEWLEILDFKTVTKFYSLKADPLGVAISFGEPILARVSIVNTSPYELTVGPGGIIRPDIWIDCQAKGLAQQYFTGVAFDRVGQKLVLKPKESVSQVVRVDQAGLAQMLQTRPNVGFPLYFNLMTNPVTLATGISPGPAGQRQQFSRVIERGPAPLDQATLNKCFQKMANGPGDAKVRTLELLGTFAKVMLTQEDANTRAKGTEIVDVIRKSTGDPVPIVRAHATFMTALLSDPAVRDGLIRQMLADPLPIIRMCGVAAVQNVVEAAQRKTWVQPLADSDPDPIVKRFAASTIEVADLPPPATQPAQEGVDVTAGAGK